MKRLFILPIVATALLNHNSTFAQPKSEPNGDNIIDLSITRDEVKNLDALISVTENTLKRLKQLREKLSAYRQIENACIQNPDDSEKLSALVSAANDLQSLIQETHLQDYFRPEFLQELDKLSKIADKKRIPSAK